MKNAKILVINFLVLVVVIFLTGGGHGTYLPAKIIFPFTMLIANFLGEINVFGIIIAIVQIPIYAYFISKNPKSKFLIIALHLITVFFVLFFNNKTF